MHLQVQVVFDELETFKLVARIHTDNETGLVHQQVLDLDSNLERAFIKLLYPNMLDFRGVTATAGAELIEKALTEKAEKEAKAKEKEAKEAAMFEPKEILVEA